MLILFVSLFDHWKFNEPIFEDRSTVWYMAGLELVILDAPVIVALMVIWGSVFS